MSMGAPKVALIALLGQVKRLLVIQVKVGAHVAVVFRV